MHDKIFLLGDVARLLRRRPHQVSYVLSSGLVPDVAVRLGGRRLFRVEDVKRLARHFGIPRVDLLLDAVPEDVFFVGNSVGDGPRTYAGLYQIRCGLRTTCQAGVYVVASSAEYHVILSS